MPKGALEYHRMTAPCYTHAPFQSSELPLECIETPLFSMKASRFLLWRLQSIEQSHGFAVLNECPATWKLVGNHVSPLILNILFMFSRNLLGNTEKEQSWRLIFMISSTALAKGITLSFVR